MADNQKVTLDIDLQLKEDALRETKRQLDELSRQYEQSFRARRQSLASGGRFSPGFLLADEDLKKATQNVKAAQQVFFKAQQDVENRSRPVTKRVAGFFQKLLYGEKVQSPEDADKEHRRVEHRMGSIHRSIHSTLAMSSQLARTLAPLPGGGVLHAGVAGMARGSADAVEEYNERRRLEGREGSGVGRGAAGLLGGIKGGAAAAGMLLLAKAIGGAMTKEQVPYELGRAMGGDVYTEAGRARHRGALGVAYGQYGLTPEQAAPIVSGTLQAGGGATAAAQAMRVERIAGQGQLFNQLLGGMAQGGAGTEALDQSAKKLWIEVFATGTAQGLQKGRIGELIAGAQQVASQRAAGVQGGSPTEILRLAASLGRQNEAFRGAAGFQTIGRLEAFGKGQSSPMARALSLIQSGLGGGTSMVEAMRTSERGVFGKGGMGRAGLTELVGRVSKMAGGDRDLGSLLLSQIAGLGINEATSVLDMVRQGGEISEKEFKKLEEEAQTDEARAYKAMIGLVDPINNVEKLLDMIQKELGRIFKALGGAEGLMLMLGEVRDALVRIEGFISAVKTTYAEEGAFGTLAGVLTGQTEGRAKQRDEFNRRMSAIAGAGWKNVSGETGGMPAPSNEAIKEAYAKIGMAGAKLSERFFEVESKNKEKFLVIELRDPRGNLLALERLNETDRRRSQTPNAKVSRP